MKKLLAVLLTAIIVFSLAACAGNVSPAGDDNNTPSEQDGSNTQTEQDDETQTPSDPEEGQNAQPVQTPQENPEQQDDVQSDKTETKILVAYFSATNNTEGVAQKLADGLGADLYEIIPETPYTDADLNYGNSNSRSSVEMDDPSARPAISGTVENMEQYDVVFVGYPIWWGDTPRIMSTFIESYDFTGKTLVAFCTSASSGFGSSDSELRSATEGATWLTGHRFPAGASSEDIVNWAEGLELPTEE